MQFTGENLDELLDDWLPTLERAGAWNTWSKEELLIQLAGHLRGRALQEWNLLTVEEKSNWDTAVKALRSRLEPRDRALAAQDFRHATQKKSEMVADYIRRMERAFQLAYGRDGMLRETRETMLLTQLQEGLLYRLVKSPAVSGARTYAELCLAAKNEEKRQAELDKRREYDRNFRPHVDKPPSSSRQHIDPRRCYNCGELGHVATNCRNRTTWESKGGARKDKTKTRGVCATPQRGILHNTNPQDTNPYSFLFSSDDSDDEQCRQITVTDQGSQSMCVSLQVEGVPAYGLIDTGADITIMGARLFKKVAAVAKLRKENFKPADKTP